MEIFIAAFFKEGGLYEKIQIVDRGIGDAGIAACSVNISRNVNRTSLVRVSRREEKMGVSKMSIPYKGVPP